MHFNIINYFYILTQVPIRTGATSVLITTRAQALQCNVGYAAENLLKRHQSSYLFYKILQYSSYIYILLIAHNCFFIYIQVHIRIGVTPALTTTLVTKPVLQCHVGLVSNLTTRTATWRVTWGSSARFVREYIFLLYDIFDN